MKQIGLNMQEKNNLEDNLIEVRKAYRLLYSYQRGVLDLVKYIGDKLDFTYKEGYPLFSNPARNRGNRILNNWSWDWLNLYFYEFRFKEKRNIKLSILILSDTGYFETEAHKENTGKLYVDRFKDVEESKTKLIFIIGKHENDYCWKNNTNFLSKEEGDISKDVYYKSYLLEDFFNEKSACEKLQNFIEFCNSKCIKFTLKKQGLV